MDIYDEETGRLATPEQKAAHIEASSPWPDVFREVGGLSVRSPFIETPCVRCKRPVRGDRCGRCRAIQSTYSGNATQQ